MSDKLSSNSERIVGEEFARRCLSGLLMAEKKDWTITLHKRLSEQIKYVEEIFGKKNLPDWAKDIKDFSSYIAGMKHVVTTIQQIIDSNPTWRY